LKDKRRVRRSVIDKARGRFNASIAEVDTPDAHKMLTIGVAVASGSRTHAISSLDEIVRFMEGNAEAELIDVETFNE
jgi:uncharacterized protein YlxP (DUF503 family)